jgi:curved DNA-binding protein CbpA
LFLNSFEIAVTDDMKDYYQILEITPEASEDEIRKSYRRLAMQYHPDRNPDKPDAEENFKEIAEAYGVLTDSVKRRQYDATRKMGGRRTANGQNGGFDYSQEDILRDLFQDPRFQQMFQGLLKEFARKGFRANPNFVKQSFFGGRGGMVFGGLFFLGSLAGPALMNSARKSLPTKKGLISSIGGAIGRLVGGNRQQSTAVNAPQGLLADTSYTARLTSREFQDGKVIQVVTQGPAGQEKLKVTIPPGSRAGQKLRLRGKGVPGPKGRGDLYLILEQA